MADYTIISDVSQHMVKILRNKMCPEPIPSPNNITASSPSEQDVDYILGLYLYDIREEPMTSGPSMVPVGRTRLQKPSKPYSLYYMLFLNGSSQMGLKAADTQKILGRAAQIISDGNTVRPDQLQPWLERPEPPITFSAAKITLEEKVRVWSAINKPYQVSLFYKAAPVFISSEVIVDPPRITEARIGVEMLDGRGRE